MIIFELYYCKTQCYVQDDGTELQALKEQVIAIESRLEAWYDGTDIHVKMKFTLSLSSLV